MVEKCKKSVLFIMTLSLLLVGVLAPLQKSYAAVSPSSLPFPVLNAIESLYQNQPLPPIYNTAEEAEMAGSPDRFIVFNDKNRDLGGYTEYVYKRQSVYRQADVGWHPDFDRYRCNVNGYGFSTSQTKTITVQVQYKDVTVTVAKEATSGSFFTIPADASRCSRPYVRADVTFKYYNVKYYDNFGNNYLTVDEGHVTTSSSNTNYYVKYQ